VMVEGPPMNIVQADGDENSAVQRLTWRESRVDASTVYQLDPSHPRTARPMIGMPLSDRLRPIQLFGKHGANQKMRPRHRAQ